MLSLWRWFNPIPRWGILFLLAGMTGSFPRAAESETDKPPSAQSAAPTPGAAASELTIEQMERLGRQMRESTPALLELITSSEASLELRRRAALALAAVGPEDMEQARILFELLGDASVDLELRRTILMAFGEKDLFAPLLVPALLSIVEEPRNEPLLRRQALFALGRFADAESVAPVLARVVARPAEDTELRLLVLDHVRRFDRHPEVMLDILAALARESNEPARLREVAIDALRSMGPRARTAAPALMEVLSQTSGPLPLRMSSAVALGQTGWPEDNSPALVTLVFDSETPPMLRAAIAGLLGRMDELPPPLATQWLPALEDEQAPLAVRRLAARLLARADLGLPDGVELGSRLLRDSNEDPAIRLHAAEFLRRLGVRAAPARETLESVLLSAEAPAALRELASTALAQVAQAWLDRPDQLDRAGLNQRIVSLDRTLETMEQAALQTPPHPQNLESVRRVRDVLHAEKASRWSSRIGDWAEAHPAGARWYGGLTILGSVFVLLASTWWALARIAPLRLGRLQEMLRPFELTLPRRMGGRALGARHVLLLCFWDGHRRVHAAWVDSLRGRAAEAIALHRRSAAADIFVDLPATVDGRQLDSVPLDSIVGSLARPGARVVIAGDAATGKTTLALRIAAQACAEPEATPDRTPGFLPAWIGKAIASRDLLENVRDQLRSTSAPADAPSIPLTRELIKSSRIVLILDGISEWAVADRDRVIRAVEHLGRPSVLTTTRDAVSDRQSVQIVLSRLNGPTAAGFINVFLRHSGPPPGDPNVMEAGRYWMDLTGGRAMPVDAVRLFAEYLLTERRGETETSRPENLLDLVRESIRLRNGQGADHLPDDQVWRLAGQLAWTCALNGGSVETDGIPEKLSQQTLVYLEEHLGLIRMNPRTGGISFLRPTMADYLAAGYLIATCGKDDQAWQRLTGISPSGALSGRDPFAQLGESIWNACYRLSDPFAPVPIPDWLHAALERDLGGTRQEDGPALNPRVRQLTRLVLAPENPDRTRAIRALAALGPDAVPAIPDLLDALGNAEEDLEIRHAVLAVLSMLGRHAASAKTALLLAVQDRKEHLFLRIKAIDALVQVAPDDPATNKLLVDRARDPAEIGMLRGKAEQAVARV
jgi:hypothetical protein